MKSLWYTSLVVVLLGLSAASAPAATVDIDVGLSQHVRYGRWAGVCIEGRNKSKDPDKGVVAALSIECRQYGPNGIGTRLSESFSLPAGSQRRQWFYTYIHGSAGIVDVRLENEDGTFSVHENLSIGDIQGKLRGIQEADLTVGVLGQGRRLLGDYQKHRGREHGKASVTEVPIRARGQLPDAWPGYDLLDILVVATGADGGDVDADAVEGLRQWVARGGTLVAPIDLRGTMGDLLREQTGVARHGRPQTVSPQFLTQAIGRQSANRRSLVLTEIDAGGRSAVLERDGKTLAVRTPLGVGSVVWVGFDPLAMPFMTVSNTVFVPDPGAMALWGKLLPSLDLVPAPQHADSVENALRQGFDHSMREQVHPGWLLLFAVIYLAFISPLDYYLVKWLKRPALTWVTYPVLIGIFVGLGYWYSIRISVGHVKVREVTVLDTAVGQTTVRARTYAALVSTGNRTYEVTTPESSLLRPLLEDHESISGMLNRMPTVHPTEDGPRLEIGVPVNSTRTVSADHVYEVPEPLLSVRRTDDGLWEIDNRTGGGLSQVFILIPDDPDACIAIDSRIPPGRSQWAGRQIPRQQLGYMNEYEYYNYRRPYHDGEDFHVSRWHMCQMTAARCRPLQHDPEDSNTLFDPAMDLSHVLAGGEGILLARTESDSASIRLAGYNPTHEQTTWVRCRFPLHAKNE